jgi:predicted transcriptional regulator
MSPRAINWACRQSRLNSNHALVLRTLAELYNDKRRCAWPSIETIASRSNCIGASTARRILKQLERLGLITIIKRRNLETGRYHNAYALNFSRRVERPADVPWHRWWRAEAQQYWESTNRMEGETKAGFARRTIARSPLFGGKA